MKKIVLFGVGSGLRDVLPVLPSKVEVVCLSDNDKNKHGTNYLNYPIVPPWELKKLDFDYIIITSRFGKEIKSGLVDLGISDDRILVFNSCFNTEILKEANEDIEKMNGRLGFTLPKIHLVNMYRWPEAGKNNELFQDDFVRYMSINILSERLKHLNLPGNIAELGVYKGDLSAFLNATFPEKRLYLFDTFEGFDSKDLVAENANNFSISTTNDFSDTSLNSVLSRMPLSKNVIPCKGYFPESAEGVEDKFCFVSIDVDLYSPIISGLDYFYPRLVKGGYIFVHDYNNARYLGVRKAVDEFLQRSGAKYLPLPDFEGSMVILG